MDITPNNPAMAAAYITLGLTAILGLLSAAGLVVCLWNVGIMLTKLVVLTLGGTVGDSLFLAFAYALSSAFLGTLTGLGTWASYDATRLLWDTARK